MASFFGLKKLRSPQKGENRFVKWGKRMLMSLGVLMVISMTFSMISMVLLFSGGRQSYEPLPDQFTLTMELRAETLTDIPVAQGILSSYLPQGQSLITILRSLKLAKNDPKVTGFDLVLHDGAYRLDHLKSLREAVIDFKQSGKTVRIFAENYGGYSNGMGEYWLASVFDEIWLQPLGMVSVNGISAQQPFLKGTLDKVGVEMEMVHRKGYKTGTEMYMRSSMSPENEETIQAIIDDMMDVMVSDMAVGRGKTVVDMKALIDKAPFVDDEAMALKLVDTMGFIDDFVPDIDEKSRVMVGRYWHFASKSMQSEQSQIAFIPIDGTIIDMDAIGGGKASVVPNDMVDVDHVIQSIRHATDIDEIKVIILRVNSPGGSPSASEKIRQAVLKAKQAGKYVIVSMGSVAASGGYWVSMDGDEIIVPELSLTGSIGVYGGKPNMQGLWDKIGLQWDGMTYGKNADMWNTNTPYNAGEKSRLNAMMDNIYDKFVTGVSKGRKLSPKQVEHVAQGRAWTGRAALKNGLADFEGGLEVALAHATQQIGRDDWYNVPVFIWMPDIDPIAELKSLIGLPSLSIHQQGVIALLPMPVRILFMPNASLMMTPMQFMY